MWLELEEREIEFCRGDELTIHRCTSLLTIEAKRAGKGVVFGELTPDCECFALIDGRRRSRWRHQFFKIL